VVGADLSAHAVGSERDDTPAAPALDDEGAGEGDDEMTSEDDDNSGEPGAGARGSSTRGGGAERGSGVSGSTERSNGDSGT
jgi:hypothetical protein